MIWVLIKRPRGQWLLPMTAPVLLQLLQRFMSPCGTVCVSPALPPALSHSLLSLLLLRFYATWQEKVPRKGTLP